MKIETTEEAEITQGKKSHKTKVKRIEGEPLGAPVFREQWKKKSVKEI